MPTSFVGLLLFVALLAPGFCYVLRRERELPSRTVSVFRETVTLVLASLGCNAAVAAAFGVVRSLSPRHTPDLGALVRDTSSYARGHYAQLAWWGLGLLVLACLLATALASTDLTTSLMRFLRRVAGVRWLVAPSRSVRFQSAWWRVFQEHPPQGHRVYVGCALEDGSYMAGWLFSHAVDYDETADRDLILSAPVFFRPPGAEDGNGMELENVGAAVVSARRIIGLFVSYVPDQRRKQTAPTSNDLGPTARNSSSPASSRPRQQSTAAGSASEGCEHEQD